MVIWQLRYFIAETLSAGVDSFEVNALMCILIVAASALSYYATRALLSIVEKVVLRSPTEWDDDMINARLVAAVSQLSPALVVSWALPAMLDSDGAMYYWISVFTRLYILVVGVRIFMIVVSNLYEAFAKRDNLKVYAVKGIFQMLKLIVGGIGVIIGISILIGKSPVVIITALGASAAVLMLVFKDTILGLVASIQLTANKMLHKGDWIRMTSHGADGVVTDISLTTIKVRNWDNTLTTIPPYSLVSESFENVQAMVDSGGRRVRRTLYIDVNSIRFLTLERAEALSAREMIDGYIMTAVQSGAHIPNLSVFRRYIENYLGLHEDVNTRMTCMVRQLDPTPSGVPVECYFFTKTTVWTDHEHIAADIMDYIYSIAGDFGLALFQPPTGLDVRDRCGQ